MGTPQDQRTNHATDPQDHLESRRQRTRLKRWRLQSAAAATVRPP